MPEAALAEDAPSDLEALRAEVAEGLARTPREITPRWFYDTRGSELFERITRLPEYYPTRTERALLERWMPEWIPATGARTLVELGAGSAVKTRVILDAMTQGGARAVYVPLDVSAEFGEASARELRAEYPTLEVIPTVADIGRDWTLPPGLPAPVLRAFLGSTLGNFEPEAAVELLRRVRRRMGEGDRFLLGVDLHKDTATLEAAYNDDAGVTAEFNLNALRVLNHELGTDFQPDAFRHRAFYNTELRRIEMHLVSDAPQTVHIPGVAPVRLAAGESIRTEISCKYDRETIAALLDAAGLHPERWATDDGLYALLLAAPA
ncbi:MAG: L-histidine N(alpha)-methyltransferase [Gemmatimonadota bacterium]|jgi:L-histidine N-alpha-methyltransferase|nr:L-histidine N(alpha)-methyltransferase [Gemmatimonadota bacterium]